MDEEQREREIPLQGQRGKAVFQEEYFKKDDLSWLANFATQDADRWLRQFFLLTKYDPQFVIFRTDFYEAWSKENVRKLPVFTWIPELVTGLEQKHMNLDLDAAPALQSRLTRVIEDRAKKDLTM